VAVGRALIANPEWARLVEEGRPEQLQPFQKECLASLV
jgi:2,4-dienoyl-CoA reductase-like NADH-dependent reductase (Old Yellow Enzyme family)